jgi:hypothetical protein
VSFNKPRRFIQIYRAEESGEAKKRNGKSAKIIFKVAEGGGYG